MSRMVWAGLYTVALFVNISIFNYGWNIDDQGLILLGSASGALCAFGLVRTTLSKSH